MATEQSDGTWRSTDGSTHDSEGAARARSGAAAARMEKATAEQMKFNLSIAQFLVPLGIAAGFLLMMFFIGMAFLRGFIILATRLPLFGVSGIIGLIAGSYVLVKFRVVWWMRIIAFLLATIIATAPFAYGSYLIYGRTSKYFATMYSMDYIQALPDGSAPVLYEKRFQKGATTQLEIDERVTVNGITINYLEYNITTANGVTGWVPREAFPANAADMLGIAIDLGGFEQEQIQTDRYVERLMEKYMDRRPIRTTLGGGEVLEWGYSVGQDFLNRSIRVNAQTPLLHLTSAEYKEGGVLSETGTMVTLANIMYADDCTIIYITMPYIRINEENLMPDGADGNTNAWRNGLIVTDLTTGNVYRAFQADYYKTSDRIRGSDSSESVVYFFPPFRTRHFSLTREVPPMPLPGELREGYTGLLGFAYKIFSGFDLNSSGGVNFIDWGFPEIRVR